MYRKVCYITFLLILSCSVLFASGANWTPKHNLLKQLASKQHLSGFTIQPPKGYKVISQEGPNGVKAYMFAGDTRSDGGRGYVMVVPLKPPAGQSKQYTVKNILKQFLAGIEERRQNWKQTNVENGKIGNRTFIRQYWSGTMSQSGIPMQGCMYVTQINGIFYVLSAQDVVPDYKSSLDMAEASILTFRVP